MERLGFDGTQNNLILVAGRIRAKVGKPEERVGNTYLVPKKSIREAIKN